MCGHIFIGYHNHQGLRQPQVLWRCSVCGRQSHMPLDCCARPDYQVCRPESLVSASAQRLDALMSRVRTRIQAWLQRRRQPDIGSALTENQQLSTRESLNELLSNLEQVAQPDDVTEKTHDGERELQLR